MKILIIIPAHNEAEYIDKTLDSLLNQTVLADEIIVVDDHSTDETSKIVNQYTKKNTSLKLVHKKSSDSHQPGSKIIKAFQYGYQHKTIDYDVVCKFDADLIFPENYLEEMSKAFMTDAKLGIFGGFCIIKRHNKWQIENLTNKDHVRGALKAYSSRCFQKINGLIPEMGWDTIDELLCHYVGYKVKTDESLLVKHLKPTGSRYKKSLPKKFGISLHQMRYDFGLALISSLKMGYNKKSFQFAFQSILNFSKARSKKIPYLVDAKQGKFIRRLRWNGVKRKLF